MAHPLTTGPSMRGPLHSLPSPSIPPGASRPPTRRAYAALALSGALLGSLGACSSTSDDAGAAASAESSPTATVALPLTGHEASEPPAPELINVNSDDGAIATAEYFLRLSLYGAATGNWETYNALHDDTCVFCDNYRDGVQLRYDQGDRIEMPEMAVIEAVAYPWENDPSLTRVDMVVDRETAPETRADGSADTVAAESAMIIGLMSWEGSWRVADMDARDVSEYARLHPRGAE